MPVVKITSETYRAQELCQVDYHGKVVPREKQTQFIAIAPLRASAEDRSVAIAFLVQGEVKMEDALKFGESGMRRSSVADALVRSVVGYLPRVPEWQVYGVVETHVSAPLREVAEYPEPMSYEIEVLPRTLEVLKRETTLQREAESAFDRAKIFLMERLEHPLVGDSSRVLNAARYLTACDNAGIDPHAAYNDYDFASRMNDCIEELLKRKRFNHPTYQSNMRMAASAVYDLRFPIYWKESPPSPSILHI